MAITRVFEGGMAMRAEQKEKSEQNKNFFIDLPLEKKRFTLVELSIKGCQENCQSFDVVSGDVFFFEILVIPQLCKPIL